MSILTILSFILTLAIYGLICYYIGYNGWAWVKSTKLPRYKKTYIIFIISLSFSFIIGRLLPFQVIEILGGFWVAIVGYSLVLLPVANLFYLALKKKGVFWIGIVVLSIYLFIFVFGSINAWSPVVREYEVEIDKPSTQEDVKILMVSDLHLGSLVGRGHLERLVTIVDQEQPDIVLVPGDIIDDYVEPYVKKNMGEILGKVKAPLGVYAVLGNHDYYGDDMNPIINEMKKINIRVLQDEFITINDAFTIVGRNDKTDKQRLTMSELFKAVDTSKPIILLDHQPYDLDVARDQGVDIHLAGHTHRGQLFPANLITDRIYENDWGYLKKDTMHSFVSSGFGTWGPPLRLGSRSEVMVINVSFTGK
ncbi:metallophosphoesterase [Bacillus sp. 31A1R]|uniref:Metallophosphoesterase n=1 Tax=Robertmurraya mangrovi TaxID=3098077 RepID=A0ABU5IVX5_9BACI|nr:metallophosphoesterase [Bacillus sp. 31A1R]MDZ5471290.1 metallophosphoesterase [Bacillus sp. 31A1R]